MVFKEIWCSDTTWIYLAQDRDQRRAHETMIMSLPVS
jgi:hypothetical protein